MTESNFACFKLALLSAINTYSRLLTLYLCGIRLARGRKGYWKVTSFHGNMRVTWGPKHGMDCDFPTGVGLTNIEQMEHCSPGHPKDTVCKSRKYESFFLSSGLGSMCCCELYLLE